MSIEELASQAGVPVRTIRYYITENLLPGPGTRGKNAVYTEEHLYRLLLIRRLVDQHVPLQEIRRTLEGLSLPDIRALLKRESRWTVQKERAEKSESPKDYVSALLRSAQARRGSEEPEKMEKMGKPASTPLPLPASPALQAGLSGRPRADAGQLPVSEPWRRILLAPGIELQVREDEYHRQRNLIDQLIEMARRHREQGAR